MRHSSVSHHSTFPPLVKPRTSARKQGVVGASSCLQRARKGPQKERKGEAGGDAGGSLRPPAPPASPFLVLKETTQSKSSRPNPRNRGSKRVEVEGEKAWDTLSKSSHGTIVSYRGRAGGLTEIAHDREGRSFIRKTTAEGEVEVQGWLGGRPSSYQLKQKFAVTENTAAFIEQVGENSVGFLTLTFEDNLTDPKEAQRRFNSFWSNVGRKTFGAYLRVIEFQRRGAVHYHLLVACPVAIKSAFDWEAFMTAQECWRAKDMNGHRQLTRAYVQKLRDGGCSWLVDTWAMLRHELPKYGLGRSELVPVRSNFEGMAKYIGKYLEKGCMNRAPDQKGVRMFNASLKGWNKRVSMRFQFISEGSGNFRSRVARLATHIGATEDEGLSPHLGKKWAYRLKPWLMPTFENREVEPSGDMRWVEEERKFAELLALSPRLIRSMCSAPDRVGEGDAWAPPLDLDHEAKILARRAARDVRRSEADDWEVRQRALIAAYGIPRAAPLPVGFDL